MKKIFGLVVLFTMMATASYAVGLNQMGVSGGYLNPDATISQRFTVAATYTNLDTTADNQVSVTGGLLDRLEVGYTRSSLLGEDANFYHAKLGFAFKQSVLKTSFALGVEGADIESVDDLNFLDMYLVGQFNVDLERDLDISLGIRSTDTSGEREYLGEATIGAEVVLGWWIFGEFKQQVEAADNQWSIFGARKAGNAVVKLGTADVGNGLGDQIFASISAEI